MPRLSEAQRNQAIGMLRAGTTPVAVSRLFGCTRYCLDPAYAADRGRDDCAIRLRHLRQRFLPATNTARRYIHVSGQTIRNRLRPQALPVRAYRPYTGSIITIVIGALDFNG